MSSHGSEQLRRILAQAIDGGADAVTFEYDSGHHLEVVFHLGHAGTGYALDRESGAALYEALYDEKKRGRGRMRAEVDGKSYIVQIKTYDSFGQTAHRLTYRLAKR